MRVFLARGGKKNVIALTQVELFEDLAVGLDFVLFPEDVSCSEQLPVLILLHCPLPQARHRVDLEGNWK